MVKIVASPVGILQLTTRNGAITNLDFLKNEVEAGEIGTGSEQDAVVLERAARELREYFAGERRAFDLPILPRGTAFQRACWAELMKIPYGQAISYGEEARRLGKPTACRAVGGANGRNPIPILIPCHRVLGADDRLGGYSDGLEIKRFLLHLEGIAYWE